uniref:NADH-ubiquinone oxidoreductase chain 5 n=1 Tax=Sepedophilus bipunctatus TaxID=1143114 RepID=A0A0S2M8A8_9COLE|nr:NADH dehydrogenase subunit 5 [Sepedophilus bipunctatus]ALO70919.1 NADH deshydrogenase subunit 5 [Sepedophilus bipunctatus]
MYSFFFFFLSMILFFLSMNFMIINYTLIFEFNLLSLNSNSFVMTILFDWMSFLFMSFVLFISSMVIYYSEEYMEGDKNLKRFILLVVLFVLSMILLIISPNLISILLGWDGLGLVSYCLVIYYQNIKSFNAGMLTALTNRIGDVAFLISIAWMLNYGSWNYIYYLDFMKDDFIMQIISYLMLLAAMTKSAQIPFSSWLPAAMAAPTPVSSLVHSSTLVTAGIYLLIRFSNCLNDNLMFIMLFIGCMTMFMSGLGANFEFDLKKIIALSTLSQLGLMMSILALMEYNLTFFHLLTHALFKATLFMCAGCIIHNLNNCQDIRFMGSLIIKMPMTCSIFFISNLALCGLPFLSGFYSKDLMLEVLSMEYFNMFIYFIFYLSTGLTVSYTFRLIYYTLIGNFNFLSLNSLGEMNYLMLKSMIIMIFMVVVGGSMLMWLIFPIPYFICLPLIMKFMVLNVVFLGMILGFNLAHFNLSVSMKLLSMKKITFFFALMWNMPLISTIGVYKLPLSLSKLYYKLFDQGWIEYLGSQNIYNNLKNSSMFLTFIFYNNLKIYLLLFIVFMIFMFLLIYLSSLLSA